MFTLHLRAKFILVFIVLISFCGFSQNQEQTTASSSQTDNRLKIRLGFVVENSIYRQILLTVDNRATLGYDFGFDGPLIDDFIDDFSWIIDDDKYVIQGIDSINTSETYLPLYLRKGDDGLVTISIDQLENVPSDMDIYLHDSVLNSYYNLRISNYEATISSGLYENRFYIIFQNNVPPSLSTLDNDLETLDLYYSQYRGNLVLLNPSNAHLQTIGVYNVSGKKVYDIDTVLEGAYNEYQLRRLTTGVYIIKLITAENKVFTKKIIVR